MTRSIPRGIPFLLVFLLLLAVAPLHAQVNPINTTAGNAQIGDGGLATSALVAGALSVVVDASGNLYIADELNNRIRFVNASSKQISTFAGTGVLGVTGNNVAATSATFVLPQAVGLDKVNGLLYITDQASNTVRVVNISTGIITFFAGNGSAGYSGDNNPATEASLDNPSALYVDGAGNLYISDTDNCVIRKVDTTPSHIITTVAGTGQMCAYSGDGMAATAATLNFPGRVVLDAMGQIYIADSGNNVVRLVNTASDISTFAGTGTGGFSGDSGTATAAQLLDPKAVAIDASGNLLIADTGNSVIRKVTIGQVAGVTNPISTFAGMGGSLGYSGDGGLAGNATFTLPLDLGVDSTGAVYIADTYNGRIRRVDPNTQIVSTVAGGLVFTAGTATAVAIGPPIGMAEDSSGNVYIASPGGFVLKLAGGSVSVFAGQDNLNSGFAGDNGLATGALLNYISGLAVDSSNNLYIADTNNNRIRRVTAGGVITTVAGSGPPGPDYGSYGGDNNPATAARLNRPTGVAVDAAGNLYIADDHNSVIRKVNTAGIITTYAGNGTQGYNGDGIPATTAELNRPSAVAVDAAGNIYIYDSNNQRIRRVDTSTPPMITTVAGGATTVCGTATDAVGDGCPATSATLSLANIGAGLAVDSAGNLYISDLLDFRVRMVDSVTGIINTVAGNGTPGFSGDTGAATAAMLNGVAGLSIDSAGHLNLADTFNARVRQVALTAEPAVTISPNSVNFSTQVVNTPSSNTTITFYNTGMATLNYTSITISGANAGDFTNTGMGTCGAAGALPAPPTAGNSCTVILTFTPSALGTRTAQLTFVDDATTSPQIVPLTGIGTAAAVSCNISFAVASGTWETAANWSPAHVPLSTDSPCIPAGDTATVTAAEAVAALSVSGSLAVSTGSLTVSGQMDQVGIVSGAGTLTISGLLNWKGGSMCAVAACNAAGAGITNANGGIAMPSGSQSIYGRTLNTTGAVTISSASAMIFGYGGTVNNQSGGSWNIAGVYYLEAATGSGTFNNQGSFTATATNQIIVEPAFNNSGTVAANAATGTLNLYAVGNSTGTWSAATGATLLISSGSGNTATMGGGFSGPGTIEFGQQGGTLTLTGSYNVTGTTGSIGAGTTTFSAPITSLGALSITTGTMIFMTGSAVTASTMNQSGGTLAGTDTVTVTGLLTWSGGEMCTVAACNAAGTGVTNANGGMSIPTGAQLIYGRTLNTTGTVTISSTNTMLFGYGGTVNNQSGGSWKIQGLYYLETATGSGTFNNQGSFTATATNQIIVEPAFNNSGTVAANAATGTLDLYAVGNSTGTWSAATGATLQISSGTGNTATLGGGFSGPGTIQFGQQGGTLTLTGSYNVTGGTGNIGAGTTTFSAPITSLGALSITTGTMIFMTGSPVTAPTMNQSGGILAGTDTVTVTGLLTWSGGEMCTVAACNAAGTGVTNANGGMSIPTGGQQIYGRTLNTMGAVNIASNNSLQEGYGTVVNNLAGGTWTLTGNYYLETVTSGVTFNNLGTFVVNAPTFDLVVEPTFNNSGAVQVAGGAGDFYAVVTAAGTWSAASGTTLQISSGNGNTATLSGSISGAGTIQYSQQNGNLNLTGPYNVTGSTTQIGPGTTTISGAVTNVGMVTAASGVLNFTAPITNSPLSSVTITSGTLNFSTGVAITATAMSQSGGILAGTDTLTVTGQLMWTGGQMCTVPACNAAGASITNANGGINIPSGGEFLYGRTLNTMGAVNIASNNSMEVGFGAVINNPVGGTWTLTGNYYLEVSGTGGTFNNMGTFVVNAPTFDLEVIPVFNNTGSVQVMGGAGDFFAAATAAGTWSAASGTMLQISSGTGNTAALSGSISGAGILQFGQLGGTLNITGPYNVTGGTSNIGGGTTTISGMVTSVGPVAVSTGVLNFTAPITNSTLSSVNLTGGTLNFSTGVTITATAMSQSGGILAGTDTLTVTGQLMWTGGQMCTVPACNAAGAAIINANGGINIPSGQEFLLGRTLNTMGAVNIASNNSMQVGYGAVINNPVGGTWTLTGNYYLETTTNGGTFNNMGTFVVNAPTFDLVVEPTFNNSGAVQVTGGAGNFFAVVTAAGTWSAASGTTLQISSGTGNTAALSGSISGAGAVQFGLESGTVNVTGAYNVTGGTSNMGPGTTTISGMVTSVGPVTESGGVLNFTSPITNSTLSAITITTGVLNFSTGAVITATTMSESSGTLAGTDVVTVTGVLTWSGGNMCTVAACSAAGAGVTNANGGMTIPSGTQYLYGRTLNTMGAVNIASNGNLEEAYGAVANNQSGGTWTLSGNYYLVNSTGGGTFNNLGTFVVNAPTFTLQITTVFNNNGAVQVNGGEADFGAVATAAGTWSTASGTMLLLSSGTGNTAALSGTISGAGAVQFGIVGGTVNVTGPYSVTGGTSNLGPGTTTISGMVTSVGPVTVSSGALNFTSPITNSTLSSVTITSGTLNFSTGVTITATAMSQSGGILAGTDTLTVMGQLMWTGGQMCTVAACNAAGTGVTNASGGIMISAGSQQVDGRTLNTMGAVNVASAVDLFIGYGGAVNNLSGGTWTITTAYFVAAATGGGTFNNTGTYVVNVPSSTLQISAVFNNNGALQLNAGNLQLTGGGSGTGSFSVAMGSTLTLAGGTFGFGGAITGPGTLTASSSVVDFNAGSSESNLPAFTASNSTIAVASGVNLDVPALNLTGSTLEGYGTVNAPVNLNSGTIHAGMSPGSLTVNGSLTMGAGSEVEADLGGTAPGTGYSQLIVTGAATLAGTLLINNFNGFVAPAGSAYVLILANSISGTFGSVLYPLPPAGASFSISYAPEPIGVVLQTSLGTVTGVSFNPTAVTGGTSSTGTVTISTIAPTGGTMVNLSSGNSAVTVPATVTVPAGQTTQTFTATTVGVAATTSVAVTATLASSTAMGTLIVDPATITSVSFNPTAVTGGTGSTGTVMLSGPAPPAGLTGTLMSNSPTAAMVGSSFTIAGNATSGTFPVTTAPVQTLNTVTITATLPSGNTQSGALMVDPPVVSQISFNPSTVLSGQTTTVTATLNGAAPTSGVIVGLTCSNLTAVPVPTGITVVAGMTSASFTLTAGTVATSTIVTCMATTGTTTVMTMVTVQPPVPMVTSVTFNPATVTGGTGTTGTVNINIAAPAGGTSVTLTTGSSVVGFTSPVTIPAGQMSTTFTVTTVAVATNTTVTITAAIGSSTAMGTLTVNAPAITTIVFNPAAVSAGSNSTGTVTLNGPAPAGFSAALMSNNSAAASVLTTVSFSSGATTGTFTVTTFPVTANATVTITVTLSGQTPATAMITVNAALAGLPSTTLNFNSQLLNTPSGNMQLVLTNNGSGTLSITGSALGGTNPGDFSTTGTTCIAGATVGPNGGTCVVIVVFTPKALGLRSATITLTDNASPTTQVIMLSGTGTQPAVTLSTPGLTYGVVTVGMNSTMSVMVTNSGTATLTFNNLTITGPNAGDFTFAEGTTCSGDGGQVVVNAMCTISITFTPSAIQPESATLSIYDNAPNSPQTVALAGGGPGFSMSVPSTSSGGNGSTNTVLPGDTAVYTLMITCAPGVVGTVTLTGMQPLPPNTILTITPSMIVCPTTGPVTITITLQTNCVTSLVGPPMGGGRQTLPLVPVGGMLAVLLMLATAAMLGRGAAGWSRSFGTALVLLVAMVLPMCLVGCGVNNLPPALPNQPTTPAGTYPIVIVGTGPSGAKVTVTLMVKVI